MCQNINHQGTPFPTEDCDPGYTTVVQGSMLAGWELIGGMTKERAKWVCCSPAKVRAVFSAIAANCQCQSDKPTAYDCWHDTVVLHAQNDARYTTICLAENRLLLSTVVFICHITSCHLSL